MYLARVVHLLYARHSAGSVAIGVVRLSCYPGETQALGHYLTKVWSVGTNKWDPQ